MALSREEIATRYGRALYDFANEKDVLDTVYDEMLELKHAIVENPTFVRFLSNPILKADDKQTLLENVISDFSQESQDFLRLLLSYDRMGNLVEIIDRFVSFYNDAKLIANGTAITAGPLDEEQLQRLGNSFAKKYQLNAVRLENHVDPSILGGVILNVKDLVIDGSVKNRLQKIRTQLIDEQ